MWKGIDVSDNQGTINWQKAKAAGVRFAVLRSVRRSGNEDDQFFNNVTGCRENNIPFSVYKYTYATTEDAARTEAQQVVALLDSIRADKSMIVWWDVEDRNTLCGLGQDKLTAIISAAKSVIVAAGYRFGLYVGLYVYRETWFDFTQFAADPLWIARYPVSGEKDLSFNPPESYKPDADVNRAIWGWQYSSSGKVDGISGLVDLDICYVDPLGESNNSNVTAEAVLSVARAWIGCNEADGSHKQIIDVYNGHKPPARGYTVKYTDSWCATFVSAVAIAAGCTDIIPTECSCAKMMDLFKALGEWTEDDSYIPAQGDIIFYDWQDNGVGDNTGNPDHVGIVESVLDGKITVIEGNKDDAVSRRVLSVNDRYIRGYGVPKYATVSAQGQPEEESGVIYTVSVADVWTREQAEAVQKQLAAIGINGVVHKCKILG